MKWLVLLSVLLFAALVVAVVLEVGTVPVLLALGFGSVLAAVLEGERRR